MCQRRSQPFWKHFVTRSNHFSFVEQTRLLRTIFTTFDIHVFLVFSVMCSASDNNTQSKKTWCFSDNDSTPQAIHNVVKCDNEFHANFTFNLFEIENVRFILNQKILKNFYSFITMLYLIDEHISPMTRFQWLKKFFWRQIKKMRNVQRRCRRFYLIVHLNKFFQIIMSQTTYFIFQPFNFMLVSRIGNEIDSNHVNHFILFL